MEMVFIIKIVELVMTQGVPAAIRVIQALDADDITLDDINALHDKVPHPSELFDSIKED